MGITVLQKGIIVKSICSTVFILSLIGVAVCVWLSKREAGPVDSYSNSTSQKQSGPEQVAPVQHPNTNDGRAEANEYKAYAQEWLNPIVILTAFLVVGVAITNYVYWRQLKEMQKTVALVGGQERTMKGQLSMMEGQLTAMQEQTKFIGQQIELAVINERAYVALGTLNPPTFANDILHISGTLVNGGRTPAWALVRKLRVGIIQKGNRISDPDWAGIENCDIGLLLAGQQMTFIFPEKKINQEVWDAIVANALLIVVDGECEYRDSLGGINFYSFGVTYATNPWRPMQRYQKHRREKAD